MNTSRVIIADDEKLRAVLSEKGLASKIQARLNPVETKIHAILCSAYSFKTGLAELEVPNNVLSKCGPEFKKIWTMHAVKPASPGKSKVLFTLSFEGIKTTLKTAERKDKGIFAAKVNTVVLHDSWARYFKPPVEVKKNVDWREAEQDAQRRNEQVKQQINDGKTFNAQKDNPWARKNLKNKNQ